MSQFVVSARKYRPTTFDEVVGQNHVAQTLKNALQTDKLAHAFLFCGPRGVGKTTCARILAKVINCQNPSENKEPCNTCSSCVSFNDNASFNIFELDAASNNSVEHIRNLIEQVRFQPQQGSHKVFIIDEVHMLSTQAFNAFLKTLEEPPPYAIFILATTEKHKILPTILSRCQIFDFKRIQPVDIVDQLKRICAKENREADDEALFQIAQKADGAMRDALSIYDKVASASGSHISYQDVVQNLNILDYDYFFRTVDACVKADLTNVLLLLDDVVKNGFEIDIFVQGLSKHLRDLLVSTNSQTIHLMEGSDDLKKRYYNQASLLKEGFILSSLNILNNCDLSLPRATNKRLQLELALAKLTYLNDLKQREIFQPESQEKKNPTNQPKVEDSTNALPQKNTEDALPKANAPEVKSTESLKKPSSNTKPSMSLGIGRSNLNKLESIKNKIKAEELEKEKAQGNLTQNNVQIEWNNYVKNHNSNSFQAAMKNVILELKGKELIAFVPSKVALGFINQEPKLMEGIREIFGTPDLTLEITVDKSRFAHIKEEEVTKTYFTRNEAMQELSRKNPKILELIKRLELKADDGQS